MSLRGAEGDEAISNGRATSGPRLLRFARNDKEEEVFNSIENSF